MPVATVDYLFVENNDRLAKAIRPDVSDQLVELFALKQGK